MDYKITIELENINSIFGEEKVNYVDIHPKKNLFCSVDYRILMRRCYQEIFDDMIVNIKLANSCSYIPQCCFLVYGNKGIGKTSFCYYLSYRFKVMPQFYTYDIVVFDQPDSDDVQPCFVRKGAAEGKINKRQFHYRSKSLPIKNNPTIIISDNIPIHEDEFSEDDIVILISSPQSEIYKVFRNKRVPIQYYIPQIEDDDELKVILKINTDQISDELINNAKIFGGNMDKIMYWNRIKIDPDNKVDLSVYIPNTYNEDFLIYDTNRYNVIPTKLRFISPALQRYMLYRQYNNIKDFNTLFKVFNDTGNERIFERLVHILIENGKIIIIGSPIQNTIRGTKAAFPIILDKESDITFPCYLDFAVYYTFPAIDGCYISWLGIVGVQMTVMKQHGIKGNVVIILSVYIYI